MDLWVLTRRKDLFKKEPKEGSLGSKTAEASTEEQVLYLIGVLSIEHGRINTVVFTPRNVIRP